VGHPVGQNGQDMVRFIYRNWSWGPFNFVVLFRGGGAEPQ